VGTNADVLDERSRRMRMWEELRQHGAPNGVTATVIRKVGAYGGGQGIWVNQDLTAHLTPDGSGVRVGLLHTGRHYTDDLSSDGIIYHYPNTNRPPKRDQTEIHATKAAKQLALPLFVLTPGSGSRDHGIHLGWVQDWDDDADWFLIQFGDTRPIEQLEDENAVFRLEDPKATQRRLAQVRAGQPKFKFDVFKRYGPVCAVCGTNVKEILDAAHLRPKDERGSDDPRNGLVLWREPSPPP
jgi:hypothetical protein